MESTLIKIIYVYKINASIASIDILVILYDTFSNKTGEELTKKFLAHLHKKVFTMFISLATVIKKS